MRNLLRNFLLLATSMSTVLFSNGQSLGQIALDQEAKLEDALLRLSELRSEIKTEQIPLARDLASKEAKAKELASDVEQVQRLRDSRTVELEALRARVFAREAQVNYVRRTLLPDYIADYEAALSSGERAQLAEGIRSYNLFLEDPASDELEKLDRGLALLQESKAHLDALLGGQRYAGKALTPEGSLEQGQFLQIGPILYFSSADSELAGLVEETLALDPQVLALSGSMAEEVRAAAASESGVLPIDPTLGDAIAMASTRDTPVEHIRKGGVWVYPILLFALVATVVAIWKLFQVFTIRHPKPMVIHDIVKAIREGRLERARKIAAAQPQPARDMLMVAVDHSDESVEMVEEVMYESMLGIQPALERFLNVIAVTAAAAPLLGLLGTVTGIIKTFRLMTVYGAGDPKPLISGISEALITTELGLVLAIPALVLHAILSRKVAGVMAYLEKSAVTFVNGLSRTAK
ncbi:MAG: MotA/TolQ/ExbB proton channel family protein [Verrucomicrobiota bacterium]